MVHGNKKMNLLCAFKKCPESLHFTLLTNIGGIQQAEKELDKNI